MSKTNIMIRGVVTTTAMTHQSSPDGKGSQMKTKVLNNGPLVQTPRLTENIKTKMVSDGMLIQVPYLTANSVRGLIRRAAADVVLEALEKNVKANGETISKDVYLSIVRGAYARTAISPQGPTFIQAKAASDHVFAGLFGGGSLMHESRFRLERDLFPVLISTLGVLPVELHHHALNINPKDLLDSSLMAPRDDFEKIPSREVVTDLENAYMEHMATKLLQKSNAAQATDTNASLEGETKSDGKTKDDLNGFTQTECIIPGVPLCFCADIPGITQAQAGMVIKAIHGWVNRNALGGGSQRGRGAFIPQLALYENGELITSNLFVGQAPTSTIESHPRIAEMLAALDCEIEAASNPELLRTIYPNDAKSKAGADKPGKAKPKAKPAKEAAGA